jgi:hypothetical protein
VMGFILLLSSTVARAQADPKRDRVASIYISETFINEQLNVYSAKSSMFRNLRINLDPESDKMFLQGDLQVPLEGLQTTRLDRRLGLFKFQLTIQPKATANGQLLLEFPIAETFIYQADSKNPDRDRVVIPVQLLSLGLASARGYLAALSGDYSIFERKKEKLLMARGEIKKSLKEEKNPDTIADLTIRRKLLDLQLQEIPLQRARLEMMGKSLSKILGFAGENEFNINNEIEAHENAILLKLKLGEIVPYLKDIQLGGIRIYHNKKDGKGEDYLIVDVASALAENATSMPRSKRSPRAGLKVAPALQIRLNEKVLSSKAVVEAEKTKMSSRIRDFEVALQDDGIHIVGKYHKFFLNFPFDTLVDVASTGPDVFEVRLRALSVLGIDLKFLTSYAMDSLKERFDKTLAGICTFEYLGDRDANKILRVTVQPKKLVPAFPDLHLVDVDVSHREFILRVGKVQ